MDPALPFPFREFVSEILVLTDLVDSGPSHIPSSLQVENRS